MTSRDRVVVVGGGLVGLFTAYYLLEGGVEVTIVDYDPAGVKASLWNAGFIVPSFSASPRLSVYLVFRALLARGPIAVSLSRLFSNPRWFLEAFRARGLQSYTAELLKLAGIESLRLYRSFLSSEDVDVEAIEGIVAAFTSWDDAVRFHKSVGGKLLDEKSLWELGYRGLGGGVIVEGELSVNPERLYRVLLESVKRRGAQLLEAQVLGVKPLEGGGWRILTSTGGLEAENVVIAAGSRSRDVCRSVDFDPRVEPARGLVALHRVKSRVVEASALLEDYGVAVAQHGEGILRVTGFFELVGHDTIVKSSRLEELLSIARRHVRGMEEAVLERVGVGFRPCTPDQLPVVGEIPGRKGLYIATGHCRLGVTLAPISGLVITNLILQRKQPLPSEVIEAMSPRRFYSSYTR